ncbi:hypothetical protein HA402_015796 [Bradysia odoriphaga]|nr:hypothetical protein HA402_015796 [Bradysia odoriphaga]
MSIVNVSLPDGFVYLEQIDPTIHQEVMYYGERNFIGERINGYKAPRVILTEKAALRLKQIQDDIRNDNYSLVIYDGYRPQKSLDHFVRWRDSTDEKMKQFYYPNLSKKETFNIGYVTPTSSHSRGSTVDCTIIELGKTVDPDPIAIKRELSDGRSIYYWQDNTVDMCSSVDLFDPVSWHDCTLIDNLYLERRNYLRQKMAKYNFGAFQLEWWHYTLTDEPSTEHFNFDVE